MGKSFPFALLNSESKWNIFLNFQHLPNEYLWIIKLEY